MTKKPVAMMDWLRDHIWQIGAALVVLYTGYLTAMGNVEQQVRENRAEIVRLEARIKKLEDASNAKFRGRFVFMNSATARINYMCQDNPECRSRFEPLTVPQ